eukprot:304600-Prymnesium_polylepis.1
MAPCPISHCETQTLAHDAPPLSESEPRQPAAHHQRVSSRLSGVHVLTLPSALRCAFETQT